MLIKGGNTSLPTAPRRPAAFPKIVPAMGNEFIINITISLFYFTKGLECTVSPHLSPQQSTEDFLVPVAYWLLILRATKQLALFLYTAWNTSVQTKRCPY
jgi:hypothetical protein